MPSCERGPRPVCELSQTCACVDLSVELSSAALELLRGTIEAAAEAAKEAVRAQLLRELDAEEEVTTTSPKPWASIGSNKGFRV